jgi:hypothetical protein
MQARNRREEGQLYTENQMTPNRPIKLGARDNIQIETSERCRTECECQWWWYYKGSLIPILLTTAPALM